MTFYKIRFDKIDKFRHLDKKTRSRSCICFPKHGLRFNTLFVNNLMVLGAIFQNQVWFWPSQTGPKYARGLIIVAICRLLMDSWPILLTCINFNHIMDK